MACSPAIATPSCRTYGRVLLIAIEAIAVQILQALTAGHAKGHSRDEPYLPPSALSNWPASRLIAGALAIIIFAIDTFTPLDIAIAVLYVIVVLMATNFLRRRGVILVALACAGLTVLSFILQHGYSDGSDSIGRTLVASQPSASRPFSP